MARDLIDEPMEASGAFDEGLVFAYYANLVARKSVRTILLRTLDFADWLIDQRGARGPRPDVALQVRLFLAIETVAAIRRKRKLPKCNPRPSEVQQALAVLDGAFTAVDTVKHRLHRLRPRLAEFKRVQAAAARARKSGRLASMAAEGAGEVRADHAES